MSWTKVKLNDICTLLNGKAYKQFELLDNGKYPVLRVGNFFSNRGWYYSDLELDENKYCDNGDLLYAWSASFGPKIWQGDKVIYHYHIWKIILNEQLVDKKYLYYALEQDVENIKREQGSGSTMMHVTKAAMENRLIPLPPLKEQKRIAAILDKADAIRRKRQQAIDLADQLLRSVFLDMFGDPVTNPKGWKLVSFGSVGQLDRGKSKHRPRNDPILLGGSHPLIQTGDVANSGGYITTYKSTYSDVGLKQSKKWSKGTLCITIAANIANTGVLEFDACFPDSVVGFTPNTLVTVEYVQTWLGFLQKIIEDAAPESAQKNINLAILRGLEIPLPTIKMQTNFSQIVQHVKKTKSNLVNSGKETESLLDSLTQQAFRGELIKQAKAA